MKSGSEKGRFLRIYLLGYNLIAFASWMWVASVCLSPKYRHHLFNGSAKSTDLWQDISLPLKIAQTLSVLECLHSVFGIVRSSSVATVTQVVSRLHIVWLIWRLIPAARSTNAFVITVVAWTLTELIRYSFYAIQATCRFVWFPLVWLRYSIFIPAYPLGILGEVICIWTSLDFLRSTPSLRTYPVPMPNILNFHVDLFALYWAILIGYLPGSVYLYMHMVNRRARVLGAPSNQEAQKVA